MSHHIDQAKNALVNAQVARTLLSEAHEDVARGKHPMFGSIAAYRDAVTACYLEAAAEALVHIAENGAHGSLPELDLDLVFASAPRDAVHHPSCPHRHNATNACACPAGSEAPC